MNEAITFGHLLTYMAITGSIAALALVWFLIKHWRDVT